MEKKIKRLLFTGEPYYDESLVGYVFRLAEMNQIPDVAWIFSQIGCGIKQNFGFNLDLKVETTSLSILTGFSKEILEALLYVREFGSSRRVVGNIIVFGIPILHNFIMRESPKVCGECLKEEQYRRKIWEIAAITVCPIHRSLLIDECPACIQKLRWNDVRITSCRCGYDFRDHQARVLNREHLRLSERLCHNFGLSEIREDMEFPKILTKLSSNDLLRVLSFVAGHFSKVGDPRGLSMLKNRASAHVHDYFNLALKVFDKWPGGYFEFIEAWKNGARNNFINCKQVYDSRVALHRSYGDYELFNQVTRLYFLGEQFGLLHDAFDEFLGLSPRLEQWNEENGLNTFPYGR